MTAAPRLPWWNKLALLGWAFWALVTLGLMAALAPIHLSTVFDDPEVLRAYLAVWPALTLQEFGKLVVALRYTGLFVFLAVAALIVWRRPNHPLTLITALMLVTLPLLFQLGGYSDTWMIYPAAVRPVLNGAYQFVNVAVGLPALLAFGFLFPTGRPAPRWAGWVALALTALLYFVTVFTWLFPDLAAVDAGWLVIVGVIVALLVLGLGGQVYRYTRVSTPAERRQTGMVVAALFAFAGTLLVRGAGLLGNSSEALLATIALQWLGLVALPAGIGVAILRYGLWEIDVLIRRTLIYSALTALLAGVYFGAVVLLQSLVRLFTSQSQSPLVTVLSTLLIAALFVPLRRRVQAFIDRRFYRRKYDTAQTVAAFGEALRNETALDQVMAKLEYVAAATVQPSQVSVWLPAAPAPRQPAERSLAAGPE